ncbi:MAG: hypothetical protein ACFFBD_04435 [Candidatus Hodarchaeota archaeon]
MASILEGLEKELKNKLSITHKGIKNASRPGQPHRVDDDIKFSVVVRNLSIIALKNISGTIRSTKATNFVDVPFSIANLAPGAENIVTKITVHVVEDTNDYWIGFGFIDKVVFVEVEAEADFSVIKFQDEGIISDVILPP